MNSADIIYKLCAFVFLISICTSAFGDGKVKGKRVYLTKQHFEDAEKLPDRKSSNAANDLAELEVEAPGNRRMRRKRGKRRDKRHIKYGSAWKWPNAVIPYQIIGIYKRTYLRYIASGISEFHKKTCVKWIPYTNQKDYVTIFRPQKLECWAYVGRVGGEQRIALGFKQLPKYLAGCLGQSQIVHELMHTVGFHHEHTRPDRDKYIKINWHVIRKKFRPLFSIQVNAHTDGMPYDYGSVMHYNQYSVSKNSKVAMEPLKKTKLIGGASLSNLDSAKINKVYCRPSSGKRCKDWHSRCKKFIRKGYCKKRATMMNENCRRSCRKC